MKNNISIIGAGNMGTALALVLADNKCQVKLWDINSEVVRSINRFRENKIYLPKVKLPRSISATADINEALCFSNVLILSIPSQYLRSTLRLIPPHGLDYEMVVNCAKGIELSTGKFMSEVVKEELGRKSHGVIADLSGPSIANELSKKHLTAVMAASKNETVLSYLKTLLNNDYFLIHPSDDVLGVELGGVMKNIYSIAIGMVDILSGSMNTRALLLTQALDEMAVLGHAMGAKKETFYGLSGIGDLIATCLSDHSRNRSLGKLLAQGKSFKQAQKIIQQVTEGYYAAKAINKIAKKYKTKLPLADAVYGILYQRKNPKNLLKSL